MLKKVVFAYLLVRLLSSCSSTDEFSGSGLSSLKFYSTFSGHTIKALEFAREALIKSGCKQFIYLAGDSSLDNKHWIFKTPGIYDPEAFENEDESGAAINGYETFLKPPRMIRDVNYWLNFYLKNYNEENGTRICSLMTAVEASTLSERSKTLLAQDAFIQKYIGKEDFLVVSVGSNDVAMKPSGKVLRAQASLLKDPNNLSAYNVFKNIFGDQILSYLKKLGQKNQPKRVVVSMIYFPSEENTRSWADNALKKFQYDKNPLLLQNLIKKIFEDSIVNIKFGPDTIPVALYEILDGKTATDYVERVEPSASGGKKLAALFMKKLFPK